MLMTKRLEVLIFIILITVVSCIDNTDKRAADVIFDADRDADIFYENIEKIVLKRFVLDSTVVFGNEPEVLYDGDIFVADKNGSGRIYRFDSSGTFLNTIGEKGRGAKEYLSISNIQVLGDSVMVYSAYPPTVRFYLRDGSYLSEIKADINAQQLVIQNGSLLAYSGYGMGDPHRFFWLDKKGEVEKELLRSDAQVISFTENSNVFSASGNTMISRESYCDTLYRFYDTKRYEPYLIFDFGKYNIPADFFKFKDAYKAAELFLSGEYAIIRKYFENSEIKIAEVLINRKSEPEFFYGFSICKNGSDSKWEWVKLGDLNTGFLSNNLKCLYGKRVIFLIEPSKTADIPKGLRSLIVNGELLDDISENSNYILAEFYLK